MTDENKAQLAVNTVRTPSIDAVQQTYTINPFEQEHCVLLHYQGRVTIQDANQALEHAGQLLDARGWKRLIVDATEVASKLSTLDLYQCASQSLRALPEDVRIALVVGAAHAADGEFMEDVARNHGLPLTVFVDVCDAWAWLERKHPE